MIPAHRSFTFSAFAGLLGLLLALGGATTATAGVINFDAVDTSGLPAGGVAPDTYLAGFGVTLANVTTGTTVGVKNTAYDTNVVLLTSPNYLSQWWAGIDGTSFDLIFNQLLQNVSVSIPQITSGVTVPEWSLSAINASGTVLTTSFSQGLSGASARRTFLFDSATNTGLQGIRVFSNVHSFAGQGGIPIDDVQFTMLASVPEPSTFLLFGLGMVGLGGYRWRKKSK